MRSDHRNSGAERSKGRPRDPRLDQSIMEAATDLLVSVGYDRLSIEGVASAAGVGKATVYRRWTSKLELVVDVLELLRLPIATIDTGSLHGDLKQLITLLCSDAAKQLELVMLSICSALPREAELMRAFNAQSTAPLFKSALLNAERRRELRPGIDLDLAASLVPSLMLQRALLTGEPGDREYAEQIVGSILLPLLGLVP